MNHVCTPLCSYSEEMYDLLQYIKTHPMGHPSTIALFLETMGHIEGNVDS